MLPRGRPGVFRPPRIRCRIAGLGLALLTAVITVGLLPGTASATNSFDNAAIADQALAHVGQSGGQCKQFANDMVSAASSGTVGIGGGYYAPYANAGGVPVSASASVKGDIIQLNGAQLETYYTGMHTAIVVSYQGSNTFDVVDSNWGTPLNNEIVHHHTWNPFATASQYGLTVNIWRLGTVATPSPPANKHVNGDYDGDGKTDLATYRPSDGTWHIQYSSTGGGPNGFQWGWSGDIPVPADYDGDGKADVAVWRRSTAQWNVHYSSGVADANPGPSWGWSSDIPVPGDYDGDGKADPATFRPSDGTWHVLFSSNGGSGWVPNGFAWGWSGDIPVPGDYDKDGKADLALWRPSTANWVVHLSSGSDWNPGPAWGWSSDIPVPADYDGDGKTDISTFRPSDATWHIQYSSNGGGPNGFAWGWGGDVPIPGDYDKDGKADIAVWRPSTANWVVHLSSGSDWNPGPAWGWSSDVPAVATLDKLLLRQFHLIP